MIEPARPSARSSVVGPESRPGERIAAVAVALLLAACGGRAPSSTAPAGGGSLAERLRGAVSVEAIQADLARLQKIADENHGTRADGTTGYDASASFVAQALRDLGYHVQLDAFTVPLFSEVGTEILDIPHGPAFAAGRDFKAMLFSASGDLTARVVPVGFDRSANPTTFGERPTGKGCEAGDLPASVKGAILLEQPGPCYRRAQVQAAESAGALAIVIAFPQWRPGFVLRPTLIDPGEITIPAIGTTNAVGLAMADAADAKASVHLRIQTAMVDRTVANVVAETPGGDASQVVMLGGHLDTALDGPGINDNGSGTMTILEVARELAAIGPPREKVRFGFWAGEELGLWGSRHYVLGLSDEGRGAIEVYLNLDMLASPNGGRLVYADSGAPSGSDRVTKLFTDYFDTAGLTHEQLDLGGGSDHFSFAQSGIPTGGLFSGANTFKTSVEAQRFGGSPEVLMDACYHRACDRADNVDAKLLEQMAQAVAFATGKLASGEVTVPR
jgi:Zn-dependent M28 family amino/carboxypeptidase